MKLLRCFSFLGYIASRSRSHAISKLVNSSLKVKLVHPIATIRLLKTNQPVQCICNYCDHIFEKPKWRVIQTIRRETDKSTSSGGGFFCTKDCYDSYVASHRIKISTFCTWCKTLLTRYPSESRSIRSFCSSSCSAKFNGTARLVGRSPKPATYTPKACRKCLSLVKKSLIKHASPRTRKIFPIKCIVCGGPALAGRRTCGKVQCGRELMSRGGRKSADIQSVSRSSSNERAFASLCQSHFTDVLTNAAVFDGWDADVVLLDEKIAVLWNGPWHYRKLNKKHSVAQVQNRDRIKTQKILAAGYSLFVVRDDFPDNPRGKQSDKFVREQFSKMLDTFGLHK